MGFFSNLNPIKRFKDDAKWGLNPFTGGILGAGFMKLTESKGFFGDWSRDIKESLNPIKYVDEYGFKGALTMGSPRAGPERQQNKRDEAEAQVQMRASEEAAAKAVEQAQEQARGAQQAIELGIQRQRALESVQEQQKAQATAAAELAPDVDLSSTSTSQTGTQRRRNRERFFRSSTSISL